MKKLFGFIFGLATMVGVFAMIYIAAAIYDTSGKFYIEPFFMRTGFNTTDITETPRPWADVRHGKLRDWLIQKFVYEYLYIEPVPGNIQRRTKSNSTLRRMSEAQAFNEWKNDVAQKIEQMANKGVRRTVTVFSEILKPENSNYYQVDYETKTWYNPNDMTEKPVVERGTIYLDVDYTGEMRQPEEVVVNALRNGTDPAVAFVFRVKKVIDVKK